MNELLQMDETHRSPPHRVHAKKRCPTQKAIRRIADHLGREVKKAPREHSQPAVPPTLPGQGNSSPLPFSNMYYMQTHTQNTATNVYWQSFAQVCHSTIIMALTDKYTRRAQNSMGFRRTKYPPPLKPFDKSNGSKIGDNGFVLEYTSSTLENVLLTDLHAIRENIQCKRENACGESLLM